MEVQLAKSAVTLSCVIVETLVEVPFCPMCDSEVILEVPSELAGKMLELSASGKQPRIDSSSVVDQSMYASVM